MRSARPASCDKFQQNRTNRHSTPARAQLFIGSRDASDRVAAQSAARRARRPGGDRPARGAGEGRARRVTPSPCMASRHGRPILPPRPMPIRPRRKGGQLVQGVLGTFDCLNPFIVKGLPAANIRGYVIESLLARGYDEPFTLYGLLASGVETDAARSYVTFTLDPRGALCPTASR